MPPSANQGDGYLRNAKLHFAPFASRSFACRFGGWTSFRVAPCWSLMMKTLKRMVPLVAGDLRGTVALREDVDLGDNLTASEFDAEGCGLGGHQSVEGEDGATNELAVGIVKRDNGVAALEGGCGK